MQEARYNPSGAYLNQYTAEDGLIQLPYSGLGSSSEGDEIQPSRTQADRESAQ